MHDYHDYRRKLGIVAAGAIHADYMKYLYSLLIVFSITCFVPTAYSAQVQSGPITLNGQSGKTLENLHITSSTGNCLTINNSTGITIHNLEIGPCGGNGIAVSGGSGITIADSYIHPEHTSTVCCDSGDGIYVLNATDVQIQGNVIAYGENNVLLLNTNTATLSGNFLVNPRNYGGARGSNAQVWNSKSVVVEGNYALASLDGSKYSFPANQSDSINMGGGSNGGIVRNNYIAGGFWANGCGLISDSGADNMQFRNNILVDTGACGIGIADGVNQIVDGNKIINSTPVAGGGNTAIYVWKVYANDPPCGPVAITNNIASELKPDMSTESGYWNGGGCGPVTVSGNTFDSAARAQLYPPSSKLPPPMIPPRPSSCVVGSPFSNQTGFPGCDGQPAAAPLPPSQPTTAPNGPVSDGFNGASLNTGVWSFINPVGNGSNSVTGTDLILNVPAGSNHDPAFGGDNAVRIAQAVGNSDFTVEVKFDSIPALQYQFEGVIVEQDAANFLRFNFGSTGNSLAVVGSKILSGAETSLLNSAISLPAGAKSLWMRIQKAGNTWTQSWSSDGSTYATVGSFNQSLTLSRIGPFAGNYSGQASAAPGFTAYIDYFSNTAK